MNFTKFRDLKNRRYNLQLLKERESLFLIFLLLCDFFHQTNIPTFTHNACNLALTLHSNQQKI